MISRLVRVPVYLASTAAVFVAATSTAGDRFRAEFSAIEAIKTITLIQTAQTQYDSRYGRYARTLSELGPGGAELIDKDLASGEKGNLKFVLQPTPTGYSVAVAPMVFGTSGNHTFFSDQSMTIHVHDGREPATVNDPAPGESTQQPQMLQKLRDSPAGHSPENSLLKF